MCRVVNNSLTLCRGDVVLEAGEVLRERDVAYGSVVKTLGHGKIADLKAVCNVVGYAHHYSEGVHCKNGELCTAQAAVDAAFSGHANVDVSENGQSDGKPDGNRVAHYAKAGVEHEENDPTKTASLEHLQFWLLHDIKVDGEWQVGHHSEKVGHRQPHEDGIG